MVNAFPPGHYFSDLLSTKDYKLWVDKHLPIPTSLRPPFMLLLLGSAGVIGSVRLLVLPLIYLRIYILKIFQLKLDFFNNKIKN